MQRRGARTRRASTCFAPRYSREALLELGRLRAGRQPAGADRLGDGRDLLLADRGRLEREERRAHGLDESFGIGGDEAYALGRARRPARAPRSRAVARRRGPRPRGRRRAAAAEARSPARGRSARGRRPRAPPRRHRRPRSSTPGGATRKRTHAPPTRGSGRVGSAVDRLAERGGEREPVQVDAERRLDRAPRRGRRRAAPRARTTSRAVRADRSCVYVGPSLDPERLDAPRRATSTAASAMLATARRARARRRTRAARRRRGR